LNGEAPDSSATGIISNSLTLARLPGESIDSLSSRALALHPGAPGGNDAHLSRVMQ